MNIIEGYLTAPLGFKAAGAHIGIKKAKKDLCLILSDVPAAAAGVFTTNIAKAAPVLWDIKVIQAGNPVKGIVVNSGNANACTGVQGINDAEDMAYHFAKMIGAQKDEILICSTGVIGVRLPMEKVVSGIEHTAPKLGPGRDSGIDAAEAIMTTDTFMKTAAVSIQISGKTVTIAGMSKGSGMIHPNMATLLSFITTDCAISTKLLQRALADSVQSTYNMISVDGDTSTNDTVLALANGMAGNTEIDCEGADYDTFKTALDAINRKLAIDIARDGEGATKLIEVTVTGAANKHDAIKLAKSVISSSLVKSAMFGEDANWGRIMCAMGYSGGEFDPFCVDIAFRSAAGHIKLTEKGNPIVFSEKQAKEILSEKDIFVDITLYSGEASATAWGCDLSYNYVKINSDYRS